MLNQIKLEVVNIIFLQIDEARIVKMVYYIFVYRLSLMYCAIFTIIEMCFALMYFSKIAIHTYKLKLEECYFFFYR